ncbi:unnamed protein product [Adineta ricciae]|uniref:Uncharacterized protein n=1 Tax=Adineta ricciae TaxID=249248 RepID=A0A815SPJ9_ADIRI|nr:unnamed protein product [Adineta ricciae]CAF1495560.1 unnamed protein product [Adineta ricciae]
MVVAIFLSLTFIVVVTQGKSASISPAVDYHLPDWADTGSMNYARALHTATVLEDGSVLVTGGSYLKTDLNSAELYDPTTGANVRKNRQQLYLSK